jgi:hypothetical protein
MGPLSFAHDEKRCAQFSRDTKRYSRGVKIAQTCFSGSSSAPARFCCTRNFWKCRRRRRVSTGQKKREAIDRKKREKVSSGSVDRISGRMMLLRHWSDPGLLIKGEWKHRCVGSKSRVARVSTIRAHKKRRHGVAATNRTFRYTLTRGHPRTPIYG